ncbi:uncharacterized protein [Oscarella lobularis]|uniref:uncharacterized protein n=1 Tax=Oscarella lobularis TaxID=121494 RepID=UPI0033138557
MTEAPVDRVPPRIAVEPCLTALPRNRGFRLSCRASEADVTYQWYFRPAKSSAIQSPISKSHNSDLVLNRSQSIAGYYFCVVTSKRSAKFAVSQLVSVFVESPCHDYVNMERHVSPEMSLSSASSDSRPESRASAEPPPKKSKKKADYKTCSGSEAANDPAIRKKILNAEENQLDASIFYTLFQRIGAGEEDTFERITDDLVKKFKDGAWSQEDGHSAFFSACLNGLFQSSPLMIEPQFGIRRTRGDGKKVDARRKNKTDTALLLNVSGTLYPVLLMERKSETDASDSGRYELHRHYEILRKEHLGVRSGSFPCLALEVEPKRVTMHGFITFNGNTLQSEIAFVAKPLESERSNADIITFLQRLRGGVLQLVEEWKKHDYQMPLIHNPEFAPDSFRLSDSHYEGLSCSTPLDVSGRAFECEISSHTDREFAIKFVFGHDGQYGGDVHKSMASANLAPQYLHEGSIHFGRPTRYVVMEMVEWSTLNDWLNCDDRIPAGNVISNLQRALNILHANKHVHGDFRPSNILVSEEGEIRMIDFDWSSSSATKRHYPKHLNGKIVWPASPGDKLAEVHDWFFCASIKAQIRAKLEEEQ